MRYIVTALAGLSELQFGMDKSDIRARMLGNFRTFERNVDRGKVGKKFLMDAYDDQGIYCLYSPEGKLEAISLFAPTRPLLDGVEILSLRMSEAVAMLKKMDPAVTIDSESAVSSRFSLGVSESPDADDDEDALVGNFFFGRAGYYS